jgi:hypothetical protein
MEEEVEENPMEEEVEENDYALHRLRKRIVTQISNRALMLKEETEMDALVDKKKNPFEKIDLAIERDGEKMILPALPRPMTYEEGKIALERAIKAENTVFAVAEFVDAHFWDGIVAFSRAIKEIYGFSSVDGERGFFGKQPPMIFNVRTGPHTGDITQCYYGVFKFPNIDGQLTTRYAVKRGIPMLQVLGEVKQKERGIIMGIVNRATELAREKSIYRGRSIVIERDERGAGVDLGTPLEFFDPDSGFEVPIFSDETQKLIDVTVMAPLRNIAACRKLKIPLRRGILFEGPYGCGKSLLSKNVAKVANENDITFILVKSAQCLTYALAFAKYYQPAVVFTEDIDRVVNERNESANDLINQIDGVVGKNDEIISVMTTNFVERIEKAMLRPGRLDTVISIQPPDPEAAARLMAYYAQDTLEAGTNLETAAKLVAGQIPATIREVVERAKLGMVHRNGKKINGDDLAVSAASMKNHNEIYAKATATVPTTDPLAKAVGAVMDDRLKDFYETYWD